MTTPATEDVVPPLRLWSSLAAVALGGALGTWARVLIVGFSQVHRSSSSSLLSADPVASWVDLIPWSLLVINTLGVCVAVWILWGPLRGRSPDDPIRLFAITGILGGLTSYSSLMLDLGTIKYHSLPGSILTLIGALGAAVGAGWLGMKLARG